jgi:hypothetical protein
MKNIFFFLLSLLAFASKASAQSDNLIINIEQNVNVDSPCYRVTVYDQNDTIYSKTISDEYELTVSNLAIGTYSVNLTNCGTPTDEATESVTKIIEIKECQITYVTFDLYEYVDYTKLDSMCEAEPIKSHTELQFNASYFDYRWNPDGNNPKYTLGFGYSGYHWASFSKHFGTLIGGGIGYMYAPLRIDSLSTTTYNKPIKTNYYSYLNGQFDVKFRFTTTNQQLKTIKPNSIFVDLGVLYNLPLYFKKITRFDYQEKMVNSFIHQYSDASIYVNIGSANMQVYFAYRPFDFIKGNLTELPKFNLGIKIITNYAD